MRNSEKSYGHRQLRPVNSPVDRFPDTLYERVFSPNPLLPCQVERPTDPRTRPARLLAYSSIVGAVRDIQSGHFLYGAQARAWVAGRDSPLPFDLACEWLGLEPDWLRPKILSGQILTIPRHGYPYRRSRHSQECESQEEPV